MSDYYSSNRNRRSSNGLKYTPWRPWQSKDHPREHKRKRRPQTDGRQPAGCADTTTVLFFVGGFVLLFLLRCGG